VIPAVVFDHSALAIHVPGSSRISQRVIRPSLVPPLRHNVKISVDAEKLFTAAPIGRIGVEDLTCLVLVENAIAGEILDSGCPLQRRLEIVERAAGRDCSGVNETLKS
jgi:hypothetical protein